MTQRYVLRLETSTGNVYGDGDVLLGNMDDLLRPADEGKPWTKTEDYLESAIPSAYEPVERSKYYGIARVETGTSDPNTLPVHPIKPGEFDVADALHPSASEFSRPALPSTILSQPFPNDVLYRVGDCLYITSAFSFHTNLVIEPNKYGSAKRVFYGNLDISEAYKRNDIAARHYFPYCPFCPSLFTVGPGQVFLRGDMLGRQGIVKYFLSSTTEQLIFYKDDAVGTQARDPINLQEETADRVNIFGQVKLEVSEKDKYGSISLKGNTSYYTSSGVLLASFDWTAVHPGLGTLQLGILPHDDGPYISGNIPNIITPGLRIHHLSVTTEPIDLGDTFGQKTYTPYLNGNGLATAWDITKKWVNKYKQDKLTAGDNITIENNVISATGGSNVDLTDYAKKSEIPDISGLQPKLTAGNNITIENNVISSSGSGESVDLTDYAKKSEIPDISNLQEKLVAGSNISIVDNVISASGSSGSSGSVDLSNYYTKAEVETLISNITGAGTQEVLRYTNVADDIVSSKIIVEDLVDDSVNTFTNVESADEVEIV